MEKLIREYIEKDDFRSFFQIPKNKNINCYMLAQGEYNINYILECDGFEKLVFRVNTASQMNLDNQIKYEYDTLNLIKDSKRTPIPYYLDDKKTFFKNGILVMSFIEGVALDYKKDLQIASKCLCDIHSQNTGKFHLVESTNPKKAILEESKKLLEVYFSSNYAKKNICNMLERIYESAEKINEKNLYSNYKTTINTELNSGNFIVSKECKLVDWEKAIYGDVAQDLGHFLAPTTTFWKTDIFLSKEEKEFFISNYEKNANDKFETTNLKERVSSFISLNCLRGLSWCSMAFVEYQGQREIKNIFTEKKIREYISEEFITKILKENF